MQPRQLRFLVLEDHDFQREMLVKMLHALHAKAVYAAADGREGLDILENTDTPLDVIISDLDMPTMDGMEFIRHVAEISQGTSLIVASALERELLAAVETMAAAYGITFLGTIEKPVTPVKLEQLLQRHRGERRAVKRASPAPLAFEPEEIFEGLKNGEFEAFFQPKIEVETRAVAGAEALARWRHPRHGLVSPYLFVKTIEDGGYIDHLTRVMLEKSAEMCRTAHEAGHDIKFSVNVSIVSLIDVTFADQLANIVKERGCDPQSMVIEVTESAATTNVGIALENLARLRMKGFGLSIDDYGTGYSSLEQLVRIPFTELKIDQAFVTNAGRRESARVILQSSLDMAKKLKLLSVAEGVETVENWNLLADLHCDIAQGYYVSKPIPPDDFLQWLVAWPQMQGK